jgi:PAS domain S-box-containing protein
LNLNDPDFTSLRLAAIVDSSDDAIISKSLAGIVQSWNAAAERIFGYTAEEMVGESILRIIPEEPHSEEAEIIARIKNGERIDHYETIRRAKNGSFLNISLTVSPIKNAEGTVIGASKIARDITSRKRTEAELVQARENAERSSALKDEFLATLSHELRTPLNAVLGWATILRNSKASGEELEKGLMTIERNAKAQAQIIEDLLDMSRIISGKVRLDVQTVDLPTLLSDSVETVRAAAEAKGIRLQTVIDPHAAPVSGDPNRLQQVFWNILSNAIKFTPKGGRVQVFLERVNSHIEVSFIDTGEGIAPEFLPHVFDRFQQADGSTTRKHGGLGLGLAIVKQLVGLHGGSVWAKSGGVGKGATFILHLPMVVVHPGPEREKRHPRTEDRKPDLLPDISLSGIRVLAVDDENDARELVKRLMELAGANVKVASSASEALEAISEHKPDVILCDIGMPVEDGYSLIKKVRKLYPHLPAVALTAYARAEDRTKAIRAGFDNHLAKPVDAAELLAVVARLTS